MQSKQITRTVNKTKKTSEQVKCISYRYDIIRGKAVILNKAWPHTYVHQQFRSKQLMFNNQHNYEKVHTTRTLKEDGVKIKGTPQSRDISSVISYHYKLRKPLQLHKP